jgi:hypothetical protein
MTREENLEVQLEKSNILLLEVLQAFDYAEWEDMIFEIKKKIEKHLATPFKP